MVLRVKIEIQFGFMWSYSDILKQCMQEKNEKANVGSVKLCRNHIAKMCLKKWKNWNCKNWFVKDCDAWWNNSPGLLFTKSIYFVIMKWWICLLLANLIVQYCAKDKIVEKCMKLCMVHVFTGLLKFVLDY